VKELMARWKVSRTTLWRECKCGRLKRRLVRGSVRFHADDVARYEREG
jgi:hypothetical protein